jgi:hypothetical protein
MLKNRPLLLVLPSCRTDAIQLDAQIALEGTAPSDVKMGSAEALDEMPVSSEARVSFDETRCLRFSAGFASHPCQTHSSSGARRLGSAELSSLGI